MLQLSSLLQSSALHRLAAPRRRAVVLERYAIPKDREAVIALLLEASGVADAGSDLKTEADRLFDRYLEDDDLTILVAEENEGLVGFLLIYWQGPHSVGPYVRECSRKAEAASKLNRFGGSIQRRLRRLNGKT